MAPNRQRGLVRIATDVKEAHVDPGAISSNLPSSGIEQTMGQVASEFGKIGDRIGRLADHAAQIEGAEAGKVAGMDPHFRTTRDQTIRGEAYDKAGLETYMARTRLAISEDLAAVYDKHAGDPVKLNQAIGEAASGYIRNAPQEVQVDLQLMVEGKRKAYNRQAALAQAARIAAEHKAATTAELEDLLKTSEQIVGRAGLDQQADQIAADQIRRIAEVTSRKGPDGKPLYTPDQRRQIVRGAEQNITTARVHAAFDAQPSLAAKQKFIADLEEEWKQGSGLGGVYDAKGLRAVTGQLRADLSASRTQTAAAGKEVAERISLFQQRLDNGYTQGPQEFAAIKSAAAATGDPQVIAGAEVAEEFMRIQGEARRLPPDALDAAIRSEEARLRAPDAKPATAFEMDRLDMLRKIRKSQGDALEKDQVEWGARTGLIKPAPIDFSNGQTVVASLGKRIADVDALGEELRIPKDKRLYLSGDEVRQFSQVAAEGGSAGLALYGVATAALGERAPLLFAQVAKEGSPAAAMLGGLVAKTGIVPAARDAADGLALRRQPDYKPSLTPQGAKVREATHAALGGSLAGMPEAENAAITLANAIYEVRARRAGLTEFDADVWKKGLREALGERELGLERPGRDRAAQHENRHDRHRARCHPHGGPDLGARRSAQG